jgi:NAD(P)-dependent dehydrogenase (short-subunit alcohol dehydrogenase family)
MSRFVERVAFVTGGASGIGLAAARRLAAEGARVALFDLDESDLRAAASAVGEGTLALRGDVSSSDDVRRAYDEVERAWGRLDVVFANAGVNGVWAALDDLAVDEWDTTIAVNLRGTFLTVKHALPLLKRGGGGSVVVTSSVQGTRVFSNAGASAYATSKAAQVAFAKMAAHELGPHGIRVNVICPGYIPTGIPANTEERNDDVGLPVETPEGSRPLTDSPGTVEQVAALVAFLASDEAGHITGTPVWIDGGETLVIG